MTERDNNEWLVEQIAGIQPRLFSMILALVHEVNTTNDILQETNLVLWRKADEYDRSRSFDAWAFGVGRMQVRAHMTRAGRDRLMLGESASKKIAALAARDADQFDDRHAALQHCLDTLSDTHRKMILDRYQADGSVQRIAKSLGRSADSVSTTLLRVRRSLAECIEKRMAAEEAK